MKRKEKKKNTIQCVHFIPPYLWNSDPHSFAHILPLVCLRYQLATSRIFLRLLSLHLLLFLRNLLLWYLQYSGLLFFVLFRFYVDIYLPPCVVQQFMLNHLSIGVCVHFIRTLLHHSVFTCLVYLSCLVLNCLV